MALTPNHAAAEDPLVRRFETYLLSERNVSENTREGYLLDICQFVAFKWGADVPPPQAASRTMSITAAKREMTRFMATPPPDQVIGNNSF